MSLVVCALLAGLVVGRLRGGSLEALGSLAVRRRRLVVAAVLAQAAGALVGGPFSAVGLVLSAALLLRFLAVNRGVRGTGLVALGLLANALVVAANGAMPVSQLAAARAGVPELALRTELDARHEPAGPQTRLRWLADVVPVPLPLRPEVVSAGDVLVAAGLAQLVVVGMGAGTATGRQLPLPPRAPRSSSLATASTSPSRPSPRPRPTAAPSRPRRSAPAARRPHRS